MLITPVKSAGNKKFPSFLTTWLLQNGNLWAKGGRQAGRHCCLEGWSRTASGSVTSVGVGVAAVVDSWQGRSYGLTPSTTFRTIGVG